MQISSSTDAVMANSSQSSDAVQTSALKKAMQVQEQQVTRVLDDAQKQSQQMTAQKTGVGGNLNITA